MQDLRTSGQDSRIKGRTEGYRDGPGRGTFSSGHKVSRSPQDASANRILPSEALTDGGTVPYNIPVAGREEAGGGAFLKGGGGAEPVVEAAREGNTLPSVESPVIRSVDPEWSRS